MSEQIALINEHGEIKEWFTPADPHLYGDGVTQPNGLTIKKMPVSIELAQFHKTNVLVGEEWVTRVEAPSAYHNWENGSWVIDQERFDTQLRRHRDLLLASCDWTQMPDVSMSDAQRVAWANYRQQLRDFPAINECVVWSDIQWPLAPM